MCSFPFKSNPLSQLPKHRYILAMQRMKNLIEDGRPLNFVDSNYVGDNYVDCSWGLCNDSAALWPDAEDHKWAEQFTEQGRVAPLDRLPGCQCPLDRRPKDQLDGMGCFWSCMVFRAPQGIAMITRDEALHLYNEEIAYQLRRLEDQSS